MIRQSKKITKLQHVYSKTFYDILEDSFWNAGSSKELKIHRIHSYPAKFPALITEKGIEYVNERGFRPLTIADVFCGCGTVGFEAKRQGISFWGCDINPVATMIAKVKSNCYESDKLQALLIKIVNEYNYLASDMNPYIDAPERLRYWYSESSYNDLYRLKMAICTILPKKYKYRLFFDCAFSNILKSTSRWLMKSIKPQVDPQKKPADVISTFTKQCHFMTSAFTETIGGNNSTAEFATKNFLNTRLVRPNVDMIITSPPYVTSYDYADLHQLSLLWLDFCSDYRSLRCGSIGSSFMPSDNDCADLNRAGEIVVSSLTHKDKSQARSIAKYFLDMQKALKYSVEMLNADGYILLVIGDTEYKGVHIENARHIVEALIINGISDVSIRKRKISGKNLSPYRDKYGRFSNNKNNRRIYSEEYIIIGRK